MFEVRRISPQMTYMLRHNILRPNQAIEDCKYDTDQVEGAFHVGAFYAGKLISVASFCIDNYPDFHIRPQYRLRAMATHEDYRRIGAGSKVVNLAENILKEKGVYLLWCKARTNVQGYYEKLGFKAYGGVFDYPPIGEHIIMCKKLK